MTELTKFALAAAVICTAVASFAIVWARRRAATRRRLRATERVDVSAAVVPGVVELVGRAWSLDPQECPVRHASAVLWRWTLRKRGRNLPIDLATIEHVAPFTLDDGSGRALVLPLPREVDLPDRRFVEPKGSGRDTVQEVAGSVGHAAATFLERRWLDGTTVREGATLYVHGDARLPTDAERALVPGLHFVLEGGLVVSPRTEAELVNEHEIDVILSWVIGVIAALIALAMLAVALAPELLQS